VALALFALAGCSDNSTDADNNSGQARIVVEAFDSPPPGELEHIYLNVEQVAVHQVDSGWIVLAEPDSTFDFLELTNGTTAVLVDTSLPLGSYTQLRLVVSDSNEVVVDGETYPLTVPSGSESGVKINLNFEVVADELFEVYVDFDAAKAVNWNPQKYILHPVFKAFKKVTSVRLSGIVTDTLGVGIVNALVEANGVEYSSATLSDSSGSYLLILPADTYDISASADGYSSADTVYTDVEVSPDLATEMEDYDFVLQ
jgi:hypothetical protein